MNKAEKEKLILKELMLLDDMTMNEVIDNIYHRDVAQGTNRPGWRFYVHLNKLISGMSKAGLVEHTGYRYMGNTKIKEKTWKVIDGKLKHSLT